MVRRNSRSYKYGILGIDRGTSTKFKFAKVQNVATIVLYFLICMNAPTIDPAKEYFLDDIWQNGIIEGVDTYQKVYQLVTVPEAVKDGKDETVRRTLAQKTTRTSLKSYSKTRVGAKINGKIRVKGSELIKFLELNEVKVNVEKDVVAV